MSLITGLRIESGEGAALSRASAKSRSGNLRMARSRRKRLTNFTTSLLRPGRVQQIVEFTFLIFVQDLVDAGLACGQHVQIIAGEIREHGSELLGLLGRKVEFFL